MIARNGTTPIKVPQPCTNLAGLSAFSRDVIAAIKGLRDRKITFDPPRVSAERALPFQIYVSGSTLASAPGVIANENIGVTSESSPTDGTWYLVGRCTIDGTTGEILSGGMEWTTSPSSNTSTDFYAILGEVEVISGTPDPSTIAQYNYGPIIAVVAGGVTNIWTVYFY